MTMEHVMFGCVMGLAAAVAIVFLIFRVLQKIDVRPRDPKDVRYERYAYCNVSRGQDTLEHCTLERADRRPGFRIHLTKPIHPMKRNVGLYYNGEDGKISRIFITNQTNKTIDVQAETTDKSVAFEFDFTAIVLKEVS